MTGADWVIEMSMSLDADAWDAWHCRLWGGGRRERRQCVSTIRSPGPGGMHGMCLCHHQPLIQRLSQNRMPAFPDVHFVQRQSSKDLSSFVCVIHILTIKMSFLIVF